MRSKKEISTTKVIFMSVYMIAFIAILLIDIVSLLKGKIDLLSLVIIFILLIPIINYFRK